MTITTIRDAIEAAAKVAEDHTKIGGDSWYAMGQRNNATDIASAIRQIAIEPAPVVESEFIATDVAVKKPGSDFTQAPAGVDRFIDLIGDAYNEEGPQYPRSTASQIAIGQVLDNLKAAIENNADYTPTYYGVAAPQPPAPVEVEVSDAQLLQSAAEMHAAFLRMAKSILAAIETRRNEPLAIVEDQLRIYIKDYADDHASIAALNPGGAA